MYGRVDGRAYRARMARGWCRFGIVEGAFVRFGVPRFQRQYSPERRVTWYAMCSVAKAVGTSV
jgi:hypothetical protein